jgi:putative ABC transport system substrate-binding protein
MKARSASAQTHIAQQSELATKRRACLQALGLALAAPAWGQSAPQRIYRIGWLAGSRAAAGLPIVRRTLLQALAELGYVEGRNLQLEARFAEGQTERLPELAAELVRESVDVIVASTNLAAFPARQATTTVPIVVVASHGAEETGLIASYARPGGNVTGVESLAVELDVKRLQLLRETLPRARRVAVLGNPADKGSALHQRWSQGTADTLQLQMEFVPLQRLDGVDAALASIAAMRANALLLFTDSVVFSAFGPIATTALRQRLPAFAEFRQFTDAGGLMSYGANFEAMLRAGARYVDRILKGAKPADLPMERPTRFEMVLNRKTALAIGLQWPQALMIRADEVIE